MKRTLALCVVAASAALAQAPADAMPCYGATAGRVCYESNPDWKPHVTLYGPFSVSECVYTGDTCTPVTVPVPSVEPGSDLLPVTVYCYAGSGECVSPY